MPGQEGAAAIAPAVRDVGRSVRAVRQLARCAQVRLETGVTARVTGRRACRWTAFTGRDLTQIVGRVEVEGLVGTSPNELGAGLP
jgi:hypothetical protein